MSITKLHYLGVSEVPQGLLSVGVGGLVSIHSTLVGSLRLGRGFVTEVLPPMFANFPQNRERPPLIELITNWSLTCEEEEIKIIICKHICKTAAG